MPFCRTLLSASGKRSIQKWRTNAKKAKIFTYNRDMICLPNYKRKSERIQMPRNQIKENVWEEIAWEKNSLTVQYDGKGNLLRNSFCFSKCNKSFKKHLLSKFFNMLELASKCSQYVHYHHHWCKCCSKQKSKNSNLHSGNTWCEGMTALYSLSVGIIICIGTYWYTKGWLVYMMFDMRPCQ